MKSSSSRNVAVIGAGAAGLVAARELRREGHQVVVFERNNQVGGTWVYDPNVDSDPLGLDPSRTVVHTSLYQSLRTNLPRQVMGFRDYPFVAAAAAKQEFELDGDEEKKKRDSRRFPGHQEVLHYLNDFTTDFKLGDLIRFETEVIRVGLVEQGKWVVGYRRRRRLQAHADDQEELYDAVVVCNGHYSEPRVAQIPGIDVWPGKQIHSHNYRVPEPFSDQVVVVIGSSASAYDISRDIAKVANEVHVASRSITLGSPTKEFGYDNMWIHSVLQSAQEDGKVLFLDGTSVHVDVILHCTGLGWVLRGYMDEPGTVKNLSYSKTERKDLMNSFHLLHVGHCGKSTTTGLQQQGFDDGRGTMEIFNVMLNVKFMDVDCCYGTGTSRYKFHFPFLKIGDTVTFDDNRVGPLYKHIFPPSLTPWLSFIGLPWKVIPFPLCELQSKWVAAVLSGRVLLPSQEAMMSNVEAFYSNLESTGVPKRYTHNVASYQFEYCDWLAAECGYRASEEWRKQMYLANQKNRVARPETYRDEWEDQYLILQAEEDFLSNIPVEMDKTSVR